MPDSPSLGLNIAPHTDASLFEQIYEAFRDRVVSGQIVAGTRLPPTRKLAEELGVSRTTVVTAYDQLIAEGFARGRSGSGVFVSEIGDVERVSTARPVAPDFPGPISSSAPSRPFSPGQPDSRLFPYRQWAKCVARVARTAPETLVMNNDPFGDFDLRAEICRYLVDWRGLRASAPQVLITAGAGDALELCIRTLGGTNDSLALEDPGYPPLHAFVESLGIHTARLEMDDHGGIPPAPGNDGPDPKLVVLTPSSQFPLGGAMPRARRNGFLAWAAQANGWIIEDDYDSEFRYAGRPIPALAGLDTHGRTLYVGSFSKIFSNGLRMGFMVLPPNLVPAFSDSLRRYGSKASIAPQRPLATFMANGDYYRHIRRVRRIYAERRSAFIDMLRTHLGDLATFEDHRAGMQIAVKLPEIYMDAKITASAEEKGISCSALSAYYKSATPQNGLLMGFCSHTVEEMANAMGELRTVIDTSVS